MRASAAAPLLLAATASATIKGFNYGSTFTTGAAKLQADFEAEFTTAQGLVGGDGFTSARLYTMVQASTANDPIQAIPAAIKTKTSLLLGLWASGGDASFQNELTALTNAIQKYGTDFTSLVDGISVGSEDLYRNSPTGIQAGSNVGANPDTIANYISSVRKAVAGTSLSGAQIGHVDTWTAWVNGSNSAVVSACDWIGVDAYPYFQDTMVNDISKGASLLNDAIGQTQNAVGGKPVWVTETGWPVSGKTVGQALPSLANAKNYWDAVGCETLFGKVNTWWYTLQDASPDTPNPSFGLVGSTLTTTPLFDLSCKDATPASSSSSSPAKSSTTLVSSASTGATSPGSASSAVTTSVGDTSGSPGIGSGISSQISFEATATSGTAVVINPTTTATGTGSSSSGSGTGSSGGSGSSNSTVTTKTPGSTTTAIPGSSASGLQSEALGAAFFAIMVAILVL